MAIKVVIFDKDGIIVETEQAHFDSYRDAIKELAGLELTLEIYIHYGISRDYKDFLRDAFGSKLDYSQYDRIETLKGKYYDKQRKEGFKAVEGIAKLVQELSGTYRLAIASSTPIKAILHDLDTAGIEQGLFELLKSGEDGDVTRNKPAPDIYLRVAEIMGVAASECVVIEDSVSGITAAKEAGMFCIARSYRLTPGNSDPEKEEYLRSKRADRVVNSYDAIPAIITSLKQ